MFWEDSSDIDGLTDVVCSYISFFRDCMILKKVEIVILHLTLRVLYVKGNCFNETNVNTERELRKEVYG